MKVRFKITKSGLAGYPYPWRVECQTTEVSYREMLRTYIANVRTFDDAVEHVNVALAHGVFIGYPE